MHIQKRIYRNIFIYLYYIHIYAYTHIHIYIHLTDTKPTQNRHKTDNHYGYVMSHITVVCLLFVVCCLLVLCDYVILLITAISRGQVTLWPHYSFLSTSLRCTFREKNRKLLHAITKNTEWLLLSFDENYFCFCHSQ